jgi:thioesterase domain-containing protein/acyl carrier protein
MVPPVLRFTESLPLSPNGKVDRNALVSAETFSPAGAHAHVSPRDALETELARIWKDVLGVDSVGVSDDFFELGGDSVLAVRMMVGVQRALGTTLPLSTLMRAATVEHLASALRHDATSDAWSPLVPILENGSTKPPLFLVHPIGGNVLCYQALARRVGFGRSVYGLQSPGLSGREPPCTSVEEMARRYLQQIREVQPEGPYLLGGWSMGGIVAWEIACQLQREGSQVELLAVLDSRAPGSFSGVDAAPAADVDVDVLSDFLQDLRGRPTEPEELGLLARAQPEERDAHLLEAARRSGLLPTGAEPGHLKPLLDVFRANRTAMHGYRPPLYVGDLMLFRAVGEEASASATGNGTPDHTLGWQALATEPVRIHNVPGDHYTLLTPPNVYFVAERLRHGLEAAGRTWAPPEVTS